MHFAPVDAGVVLGGGALQALYALVDAPLQVEVEPLVELAHVVCKLSIHLI